MINIKGACCGCGATFIAVSLAEALALYSDSVAYLEGACHDNCHSIPFYELSLDRNIWPGRFNDFYDLKKHGLPLNSRVNYFRGVDWVVSTGGKKEPGKEIHPEEIAGEYVICDNAPDAVRSDLTICVIDVMPAKVLASAEIVSKLKEESGDHIRWIMNKTRGRNSISDAEKFLGVKADWSLCAADEEAVYDAQFKGEPVTAMSLEEMQKGSSYGFACTLNEIAMYILTLYPVD